MNIFTPLEHLTGFFLQSIDILFVNYIYHNNLRDHISKPKKIPALNQRISTGFLERKDS